jgi:cytochrome P450
MTAIVAVVAIVTLAATNAWLVWLLFHRDDRTAELVAEVRLIRRAAMNHTPRSSE